MSQTATGNSNAHVTLATLFGQECNERLILGVVASLQRHFADNFHHFTHHPESPAYARRFRAVCDKQEGSSLWRYGNIARCVAHPQNPAVPRSEPRAIPSQPATAQSGRSAHGGFHP